MYVLEKCEEVSNEEESSWLSLCDERQRGAEGSTGYDPISDVEM